MSAQARRDDEPGERFLAMLADPRRPALPWPTAIVVAHPDDETIGCGALLRRLREVTVIHVTDGAPRNGVDAKARGFATPQDYAAARRAELEAATALAGLAPDRLIALCYPDQQASHRLPEIARDLAGRLAGRRIAITHAYEGGHPDHDATAFATHAACALLGDKAPSLIEMPLYRAAPHGWATQQFEPGEGAPETVIELSPEERGRKRAMFAAHASQHSVLERFDVAVERFRPVVATDFTILPNSGQLLYEGQDWGMSGARWLELSRAALAELGSRAQP